MNACERDSSVVVYLPCKTTENKAEVTNTVGCMFSLCGIPMFHTHRGLEMRLILIFIIHTTVRDPSLGRWYTGVTELLSYHEEDGHQLEDETSLAVNTESSDGNILLFSTCMPAPSLVFELGIYRIMFTRTHSRAFEVKRNRQ